MRDRSKIEEEEELRRMEKSEARQKLTAVIA
jgi:hypothetical protein